MSNSNPMDKTMMIDSRRIEAGIIYAVLSILSPFTLILWFNFSDEILDILNVTNTAVGVYVTLGLMLAIVILWASAVVSCVSDIARVYSKAGRLGLFALLLSPVIWLVSFLTLLGSSITNAFSNLL